MLQCNFQFHSTGTINSNLKHSISIFYIFAKNLLVMKSFYCKLRLASLLVLSLHSLGIKAQLNNYDFFVLNRPFTFLSDSVSLNQGLTWDDPDFTIPLPFDMLYMGEPISSLYCTSLGLGAFYSNTQEFQGNGNIFIASGIDLVDRAFDFENGEGPGSLSPYSYKVEGVSPNRIVKIEIRNSGFYNSLIDNANDDQFINLQVWLYESDNAIEIAFGPVNITSPLNIFDGENGTFIGMLPQLNLQTFEVSPGSFLLAGPVQKPNPVAINTLDQVVVVDGIIPESTVYRFVPIINNIQPEQETVIQIWPNPANDILHINSSSNAFINSKVEVSDASGKVIMTYADASSPIAINELEAGFYFVRVYSQDQIYTGKFIKR